jgi:hypothetical protein
MIIANNSDYSTRSVTWMRTPTGNFNLESDRTIGSKGGDKCNSIMYCSTSSVAREGTSPFFYLMGLSAARSRTHVRVYSHADWARRGAARSACHMFHRAAPQTRYNVRKFNASFILSLPSLETVYINLHGKAVRLTSHELNDKSWIYEGAGIFIF